MRLCDGCSAKMAPYVPRKKVDGQYLCPACAEKPRGGFVSATATLENVAEAPASFDPTGMVSDDTDGHFTDGIDTSGVHPIAAPLSPIIWENYRHRRALLGVDPYPKRVYDEARGKIDPGKAKRRQMSKADLLAAFKERSQARHSAYLASVRGETAMRKSAMIQVPHPDDMDESEMKEHLVHDHGYKPESIAGAPNLVTLKGMHDWNHKAENFTKDPEHKGEPLLGGSMAHEHAGDYEHQWGPSGKPETGAPKDPEPLTPQVKHLVHPDALSEVGMGLHLKDYHGLSQADVDATKGGEGGLKGLHDNYHDVYNYAQHPEHGGLVPMPSEGKPHSHENYAVEAEGLKNKPVTKAKPSTEPTSKYQGLPQFPHPDDMDKETLKQHLVNDHAYGAGTDGDLAYLKDLHDTNHGSENFTGDPDHKAKGYLGYGSKQHVHDGDFSTQWGPSGHPEPSLSSAPQTYGHPENMSQYTLMKHLQNVHKSDAYGSHEDNLANHAEEHKSGQNSHGQALVDHSHEMYLADNPKDMTPDALATHMVKHHGYPKELIDDTLGEHTAPGIYSGAGILGLHSLHNDSHQSENWAMHPDHTGPMPTDDESVPHLHSGNYKVQTGKKAAQTGVESVSPKATTDEEHEAKWGTPENPKGMDDIPDVVKKSGGFHHLIQHHGLNPDSLSVKSAFTDPSSDAHDHQKFVTNWLANVHNHTIGDPSNPVTYPDAQGEAKPSHSGLHTWDHTKDADGETILGTSKKGPAEYGLAPLPPIPGLHGKMSHEELKAHLADLHPNAYVHPAADTKGLVNTHEDNHKNSNTVSHTHDQDGNVISLASEDEQVKKHATDMGPAALKHHLAEDHGSSYWDANSPGGVKSMEDMLAQHEQEHESGKNSHGNDFFKTHVHKDPKGVLAQQRDPSVGVEGEYLGSPTLPQTTSKDDVLKHLIKHHPNVTEQDYATSAQKHQGGLKAWHEYLHSPEAITEKMAAPDGHTHEEDKPVHTDIPIGVHLVTHHGMSQEEVAGMKAAEFKAHHQRLHDEGDDDEIGHSHLRPGGPVIPPRQYLTNPEYEGTEHEHTWYHGTHGDYEGVPNNATDNFRERGTWGRFGDDDWNCHPGSHWTSLHGMAKNFGGGRVIHAKLKMKNPKVYNDLNSMSHDAYERLVASGDLKGSSMEHYDSGGTATDRCCNGRLTEYAKGAHRDDGKYGLQRFRDSLRADGHDGIMVRNHADSPRGHWNAIPLSPHDVEITEPHCNSGHGDKRADDSYNFKPPADWKAPSGKRWTPSQEERDAYPKAHQVDAAAEREIERRRGDLGGNHPDPDYERKHHVNDSGRDYDDDEDDETWCSHCETDSHNTDDDDEHKYCSVCEEYGHEPEEMHSHCEHCDEYADHDSDGHEDEHGEHPNHYKPEDYCPHCTTYDKDNRDSDDCVSCGVKLPDVHKWVSHGVVNQETKGADKTGEPEYDPEHSDWTHQNLADHLTHDHGSDVSGPQYQTKDSVNGDGWNEDALKAHHAWLHHNPEKAKVRGFATFDHTHKEMPDYKKPEDMTPGELHLHIQSDHAGQWQGDDLSNASHEDLLKHHKRLHSNTGPQHDYHDFLSHSHGVTGSYESSVHPDGAPKDDEETKQHIADFHPQMPNEKAVSNQPGWWKALHEKMHDNPNSLGKAVNSIAMNDHAHTAEGMKWTGKPNTEALPNHEGWKNGYASQGQWVAGKMLAKHLQQGHGLKKHDISTYGLADMVKQHILDHAMNPKAGGHDHHEFSGAQVNYLEDIKGHMATDHGEDVSGVNDLPALHRKHAMLHAQAVSGNGEVNHEHHIGHYDHTVPDSLNYPHASYWSTADIHQHLNDNHGYKVPPLTGPSALNDLHAHWHKNPEHAVEHGYEIDHAHTNSGANIPKGHTCPYLGTDNGHALQNHLKSYHYDISDSIKNFSPYDASHVQQMFDLHEKAHADGEGLAKFHGHLPDPNKPVVDDPSINDNLAKHLVGKHGWKVSDFEGKTNQDLIASHHDAHWSMDPSLPTPKHQHDQHSDSELGDLHEDNGVKPKMPVPNSAGWISDHLKYAHDLNNSQIYGKLPDNPTAEDWAHLHKTVHADPEHLKDLKHSHPYGLQETDNQDYVRLYNHMSSYHGYHAPVGYHSHEDLKAAHRALHDNPDLHSAPAFQSKSGKPVAHHHLDDVDDPMKTTTMSYGQPPHWKQPEPEAAQEPAKLAHFDALPPGLQKHHLVHFHGMPKDLVDSHASLGPTHLSDLHTLHHNNPADPNSIKPHTHAEVKQDKADWADSLMAPAPAHTTTTVHKHFGDMSPDQKVDHMVNHHGWTNEQSWQDHDNGVLENSHAIDHGFNQVHVPHTHAPKKPKYKFKQPVQKDSALDALTFFQMEASR